ncbi:hypothetical protein BDK51DRAFT_37277 [Blyttiomyces helicus]|uniref:Uncharacterized protein n=1 Tax=Blyttiomyces helicus TaxID=388810 RepID=A0A4V1IPW0_9FUNG|nr:hypothetical protein BDK51DRAFT_37277 [Blyttiomyces helicus]|eukprot:RKO84427.1 hypothetical protein BDK51DRAFT_37277 [Blyttiomyces helicus]
MHAKSKIGLFMQSNKHIRAFVKIHLCDCNYVSYKAIMVKAVLHLLKAAEPRAGPSSVLPYIPAPQHHPPDPSCGLRYTRLICSSIGLAAFNYPYLEPDTRLQSDPISYCHSCFFHMWLQRNCACGTGFVPSSRLSLCPTTQVEHQLEIQSRGSRDGPAATSDGQPTLAAARRWCREGNGAEVRGARPISPIPPHGVGIRHLAFLDTNALRAAWEHLFRFHDEDFLKKIKPQHFGPQMALPCVFSSSARSVNEVPPAPWKPTPYNIDFLHYVFVDRAAAHGTSTRGGTSTTGAFYSSAPVPAPRFETGDGTNTAVIYDLHGDGLKAADTRRGILKMDIFTKSIFQVTLLSMPQYRHNAGMPQAAC